MRRKRKYKIMAFAPTTTSGIKNRNPSMVPKTMNATNKSNDISSMALLCGIVLLNVAVDKTL